MPVLFALVLLATLQQDVKFKPSDEFELKVDYNFRTRPVQVNSVNLEHGRKNIGPLPFIAVTLKVLKALPQEQRVRIVDNLGEVIINRKIREGSEVSFDLGFTADMKDRVGPHEFVIYFQGSDRKEVSSRVLIHVAQDGTFLVNGEVRGRF
ncbi:MAG TPA: hypothetical protein VIL31_09495 [Cyclobacteriaceae bacterium]|jgi:hypothetical protein